MRVQVDGDSISHPSHKVTASAKKKEEKRSHSTDKKKNPIHTAADNNVQKNSRT